MNSDQQPAPLPGSDSPYAPTSVNAPSSGSGSHWPSPLSTPRSDPSSSAYDSHLPPFPQQDSAGSGSRVTDPLVVFAGVVLGLHLLVRLFAVLAPAIWLGGSDGMSAAGYGVVSFTITAISWVLAVVSGILALIGFRNARSKGKPGYVALGIASIAAWETVAIVLTALTSFITPLLWSWR